MDRDSETEKKYKEYIQQTKIKYKSTEDEIRINKLGFEAGKDDETLKIRAEWGENSKSFAFNPNGFPYSLAPDCSHQVLWALDEMKVADVDQLIKKSFPNKPFVWWRNCVGNQSIKNLWHVHIIIKMS